MIEKLLRCFPKKFEAGVVPFEEFKNISRMHIDKITSSLINHESRMNNYDDTPLENAFKSKLHVTRGRGRATVSSRGIRGQSVDHSDNKNDSEYEEKLQQNTPNVRGSSSRTWNPRN